MNLHQSAILGAREVMHAFRHEHISSRRKSGHLRCVVGIPHAGHERSRYHRDIFVHRMPVCRNFPARGEPQLKNAWSTGFVAIAVYWPVLDARRELHPFNFVRGTDERFCTRRLARCRYFRLFRCGLLDRFNVRARFVFSCATHPCSAIFSGRLAQYTAPGWSSSPSTSRLVRPNAGSAAPAEMFRQSRNCPTTRGQLTHTV